MSEWLSAGIDEVVQRLREEGLRRAWIVAPEEDGEPLVSTPLLSELSLALAEDRDYRGHEAIFLEVGAESGALFGAFLHSTRRGQAQGGARNWSYPSFGDFLRDGLRLSLGMGRKCALAGLWWGGGKGIIARDPGATAAEGEHRRRLYAEYARFVTSLRGAYVTAEDAGTRPEDMHEIHQHTRFATCIPSMFGGSGNPSATTAAGVVCAMEAALEFRGEGDLNGKCVAMQGAGNVGGYMIAELLKRGVAWITASEISGDRLAEMQGRFARYPVEIVRVEPGDDEILTADVDVLAPNGLGEVLTPKTIPRIRAGIVCGAANNPLEDDERDSALLAERGITYVPDYLANRMGIVHCANEQYGSLPDDPSVLRHLDRRFPGSIHQVTARVLEHARDLHVTPVAAANSLSDELVKEPHPIWGHRTRRIISALVTQGWEKS